MKIHKKVVDRISTGIKQFKTIAEQHKTRDVSEADTVTLVKDMLSQCFGFDKYTELTSEQQIRGQFCDLAVKIDDKIKYLIEVKSAATDLNSNHTRQVVTYGANAGIKWVILTNSIEWQLYKVVLDKAVNAELVTSINIFNIDLKSDGDLQKVYLLCREGISADAIDVFHQRSRLFNKFTVSQVIMGEKILSSIRRDIKRLFPDIKVSNESLLDMIQSDIFKRELLDSDDARSHAKLIKRIETRLNKASSQGLVEIFDGDDPNAGFVANTKPNIEE